MFHVLPLVPISLGSMLRRVSASLPAELLELHVHNDRSGNKEKYAGEEEDGEGVDGVVEIKAGFVDCRSHSIGNWEWKKDTFRIEFDELVIVSSRSRARVRGSKLYTR